MHNVISVIHEAVAAVAPIDGVSIGTLSDKQTWTVCFKEEATTEERAAAQTVIDNFSVETAEATLTTMAALSATDTSTVRVLEDLIGVLVDKSLIALADLPESARTKLTNRQNLRDQL